MSMFFIALLLGIACSNTEFSVDNAVDDPSNPIVIMDSIVTEKNTPVIINLLEEEDLESALIKDLSKPNIGTAVINQDNTITYTPNENEIGEDAFEYTIELYKALELVSLKRAHITILIPEPEEVPHPEGENIYYVTTKGKKTNDGSTEKKAWNIKHAFETAKAGDIIYIKAGNYGAVNLEVSNSGNEANPIKFIGYKENPGDIIATEGSTFKYGESTYSTADYPTLEGVRSNGDVEGTALRIHGRYTEIHNLQIKNKRIGIRAYSGNNTLNNVIVLEVGNYSGRSGRGVLMGGNQNKFINSFVKNGTELFSTSGNYNLIENNWIGCDQNQGDAYSAGYYLLLYSTTGKGANYNIVRNNTVYRQPGQYHQAHGLILKGTAQYNQLIDNTVLNAPIELSMDGVAYNTITGGIIKGTGATGDRGHQRYSHILVANGAHHNTFQDMIVTGDVGVRFADWQDGTNYIPVVDAEDAGNNNLFKNILFDDLITGVEFGWHRFGPGEAWDNTFENCTFSNIHTELFRTARPNSGTKFKDCTFINNSTTVYNIDTEDLSKVKPKGEIKHLDVTFENCIWQNNGFPTP